MSRYFFHVVVGDRDYRDDNGLLKRGLRQTDGCVFEGTPDGPTFADHPAEQGWTA